MSIPLINKFRPSCFDEVLGHEEMVAALRRAIASPTCPHSYLLTGPSGIGKTTIARIIGTELGAEINEIDAASNNGVDAMRDLVELGQHMSLSGAGRRAVIIDECHALSKAAWQVLLKLLEEPPAHLYLMLCTTESDKIIETIRTRCFTVTLRTLRRQEIEDLLSFVAETEGWQVNNDVMAMIVAAATGQPRKALALLDVAHDAPSREEVARIINLQETSEPILELCQLLVKGGGTWKRVREILERVGEEDYDGAQAGIAGYIIAVMQRSDDEKQAARCWTLLDALTFPAQSYNKKALLFAALGRILWGG